MKPLHQHFVHIAKKYSGKTAFIERNSGQTITYSKALMASLILSERFMKFDSGFLGIMLPTSAGCALSVVGTLMSGRTPVMINYSTGAAENCENARKRCGLTTIVTSKTLLEKISCPDVKGTVFIEDIMDQLSVRDKLKAAFISKLPADVIERMIHGGDTDDSVVVLFTSGSEKDPKAVELTHRNITSNIRSFSSVVELSSHDRMLASLPFFHVFGLTVNLWTPLYHGMTMIAYANPLDYKMVCSIIREEEPTVMAGTPGFLSGYVRKSDPGDFSSLRIVVSGADKCPASLIDEYRDKHAIRILEGYGTTETSPVISTNTFDHYRAGSIGKVLPGVKVRIENYETGKTCGTGETGKILVKGDLVMKGYLKDSEETSSCIRDDWYDTGDMGYIDVDGFLWHSGRLKRFAKIGGEMISLVRVEDVLSKMLPADVACCVIEVPDAVKGSRIVAALTRDIDERRVLKQMAELLPNLALPRDFIVIDELPKMGSGKIDFRSVATMVKQRIHERT